MTLLRLQPARERADDLRRRIKEVIGPAPLATAMVTLITGRGAAPVNPVATVTFLRATRQRSAITTNAFGK
jgi:hypothetical protein